MSFLLPEHQDRVAKVYHTFENEDGFAAVATINEIAKQQHSLAIPLYVKKGNGNNADVEEADNLHQAWQKWQKSSQSLHQQVDILVDVLDNLKSSKGKHG